MKLKTKCKIMLLAVFCSGLAGFTNVMAAKTKEPSKKRAKIAAEYEADTDVNVFVRKLLCLLYDIEYNKDEPPSLVFPKKTLTLYKSAKLNAILGHVRSEGLCDAALLEYANKHGMVDVVQMLSGGDKVGEDDAMDAVGAVAEVDEMVEAIAASEPEPEFETDRDKERYIGEYMEQINLVIPGQINKRVARAIIEGKKEVSEYLVEDDTFMVEVAQGITAKYRALYRGELLNNGAPDLKDEVKERVRCVPQGQDWKSIPFDIVIKSERLCNLWRNWFDKGSLIGGVYGRMDSRGQSCTITRGYRCVNSGAFVHPIFDRTLAHREAARFQTFPDSFFFYGKQDSCAVQIGNAVPPLFAYQLGTKLKEHGFCKSVDLFCGAGGMTLGFKAAGITPALCVDFNEDACKTLKINSPEANVLFANVTQRSVQDDIAGRAVANGADIICGGPPCQGFSTEGERLPDDPRNKMYEHFAYLVDRIKPKVVVFENVKGLLNMENGEIYNHILQLFRELGYKVEAKPIQMSEYGIPQSRERVIIICVRGDLEISPSALFPDATTLEPQIRVTVGETISDLVNGEHKTISYGSAPQSKIEEFFRGDITYEEYMASLGKRGSGADDGDMEE